MNNSKLVKILGLVATVGGVAMTLLTDYVNEKKMDEKINEWRRSRSWGCRTER